MPLKIFFTLLSFFCTASIFAQNITGVWRGYFINGMGFYKQRYKFEVQFDNKPNGSLGGVTYSYRSTLFYGKASLQGVYMNKNKTLVFKENKLLEVRISDSSNPCLMTCYLDYEKQGTREILSGTYTSLVMNSGGDCGAGIVYLEKVPESDFKKENFVIQYENRLKKKHTPARKPTVASKPKPAPKPQASSPITPDIRDKIEKPQTPPLPPPVKENSVDKTPPPPPAILKERENHLVQNIYTSSKKIKIELYDNGTIDNDTVTVYHNSRIIAYKQRLTHDAITFNIDADEDNRIHEFIMVADNLGEIPPNTALMVITAGNKRYELNLVSTEQKNAKVIIHYKPN